MGQEIVTLRYGNTRTFLVRGVTGSLLVDTDYAGTMAAFHRALREHEVRLSDVSYVMATHFHPDHCGLIGQLQGRRTKLLLVDSQVAAVRFPDYIFARDKVDYAPVDPDQAVIIPAEESRRFLKTLGIDGEIIRTGSHSEDSVSLILDDGNCFVGDLEPREYVEAYDGNPALANDWDSILARNPRIIHYAHAPERPVVKS